VKFFISLNLLNEGVIVSFQFKKNWLLKKMAMANQTIILLTGIGQLVDAT
jgi:hypothetical protein